MRDQLKQTIKSSLVCQFLNNRPFPVLSRLDHICIVFGQFKIVFGKFCFIDFSNKKGSCLFHCDGKAPTAHGNAPTAHGNAPNAHAMSNGNTPNAHGSKCS